MPNTEILTEGNELVVSAWYILSRTVKPGTDVLVFDDAGDHAGLQTAEMLAEAGAKVEIMTPDRSFAPEVMAMNLVPYMRFLQQKDAAFTVTYRLTAVEKNGNHLVAHVGSDYGGIARQRRMDQAVVNHGTISLDEIYFDLKPASINLGELSHEELLEGFPSPSFGVPMGGFSCSVLGMRLPPAIRMRQSMMPCGCSRMCDSKTDCPGAKFV